jgi:hypothetical protein
MSSDYSLWLFAIRPVVQLNLISYLLHFDIRPVFLDLWAEILCEDFLCTLRITTDDNKPLNCIFIPVYLYFIWQSVAERIEKAEFLLLLEILFLAVSIIINILPHVVNKAVQLFSDLAIEVGVSSHLFFNN